MRRQPRRTGSRRFAPVIIAVLCALATAIALTAAVNLVRGVRTVHAWLSGSEPTLAASPTPTGPAPVHLDTTGFDPTHIIDDDVFYDSTTMTSQDIADFIATVNEGCQPGADGTSCLADAVVTTEDEPASLMCPQAITGAESVPVADVIWQVSQACDINPQVLLVLIQKEQGLLTASGLTLTARDYAAAAGYACPDGADCDPAWSGFFRQLYGAAAQFQRYRLNPWSYRVVAGVPTTLAYAPTDACGSGELTVTNQATAGLYDYTPYLANDAVANGGDDCSSWGNWNFYGYFRTFFGDPTPSTP